MTAHASQLEKAMRKFPGLILTVLLLAGCRGEGKPSSSAASSPAPAAGSAAPRTPAGSAPEVRFEERSAASGLDFVHVNGAFGRKWLPETMGSGAAFLDYDGDGDQDLFLVNGRSWPGRPSARRASQALYQNDGKGSFRDVTKRAGLELEYYGMGAAAGDVDNDGDVDLYLTGLGPGHLFLNQGDGTFRDATAGYGVGDPGWSTSAAFLDYDRDGDLDLFVCNYVSWTPETDLFCTLDGKKKSYCTPESYRGLTSRLYRNEAGARFSDVSAAAGIAKGGGKSLGVATLDFDEDGWMDLAVANDTQPNQLFRNRGDGSFAEMGVETGMAYSESGVARGAMGIDAGDYLNRGPESLLIGNFSNQMLALYHNSGKVFIDKAPTSALGSTSLLFLAFGLFFFDYDLDGFADILVANGHVEDEIQTVQERVTYEERPLLYRNLGNGNFEEVGLKSGPALAEPVVGRGAAYADVDGDGDLDALISVNHGAPRLLINGLASRGRHAIRLVAEGTTSNRSGIGARFRLRSQGKEQRRWVKSGSSYCSQSELPVTFGLGEATAAEEVEVTWPGGGREALGRLEAGRAYVVREGKGVVDSRPLAGSD
jgi:hypothetical protein